MIILYGSTAYFGLPDPSPFVTKAEVLLKMSGLPYENKEMSFKQAPKNKVPYIGDEGRLIADSYFIRHHMETRYHIDFSGGYSTDEQARAWTIERMLEEHFYWFLVHDRWANDENFERGPRQFFLKAPAPVRPFVTWMVRRIVNKALHAQGTGRHNDAERLELAKADVDAVSVFLGNKPYLLGDRICGADATVFSFMLGASCPLFESDIRRHIEQKTNIMDYVARLNGEFYGHA